MFLFRSKMIVGGWLDDEIRSERSNHRLPDTTKNPFMGGSKRTTMDLILSEREGSYYSRPARVAGDPEELRAILSPVRWKILKLLSREPMYSAEIAKRLHMQEQQVHYHVKYLKSAGVVEVCHEEQIRGGLARYYQPASPAFAVTLPFGEQRFSVQDMSSPDGPLRKFLSTFLFDGTLAARIVVGSPMPHGPHKAVARDGHYAAYLGLFLGQFVLLPREFCVTLDTDIKAEKDEGENLILIGGPGTNLMASEVNSKLPIRFSERNFWRWIESEKTGNHYTRDSVGVVAKIPNPFNEEEASIMVLAGLRAIGTKSCVLGLCKQWKDLLRDYDGQESWACVVQGYDFDGDGKVDGVEVLERFP